jgi:hypothetical protein
MTPQRFIVATVVGGLVLFVVGYLIWGLGLMGYFEAQSIGPEGMTKTEEEMSLPLIFLSNLIYGAFLTLTVGVWAGKRSFGPGFTAGLLVGLLGSLAMTAMFLASMNFMTLTGHLVDTLASGVWAGIGGGVIALILARGEGSGTAA